MRKVTISVLVFLGLSAFVGLAVTSVGRNGGAAFSTGAGVAGVSNGPAPAKDATSSHGLTEPAAVPSSVAGGFAAVGPVPQIGPDVVKTATLELQIAKGRFTDAFRAATLVAGRSGGYVESSSTSGTRIHSGSLTIRVPSASFEQAMNDLSKLGTIEQQSVSGQDVTSQYVDLNARLRTWEAQEAVLLRLMRKANSIEEMLRVQSNLQDVQFRIEQIKGELRVLQNQTQLATIDVTMHEPGAPAPFRPRPTPAERPSLGEAWTKAVNGFIGVLFVTLVGLGYLVPIALIGLGVWFAVRRVRIATASTGS